MNTLATSPVRSSALPCRPSGTLAVLLFAVACAFAGCDQGPVDPNVDIAPLRSAPPVAARGHTAGVAAYFGDEYAEVQRSLHGQPDEPLAPTY